LDFVLRAQNQASANLRHLHSDQVPQKVR